MNFNHQDSMKFVEICTSTDDFVTFDLSKRRRFLLAVYYRSLNEFLSDQVFMMYLSNIASEFDLNRYHIIDDMNLIEAMIIQCYADNNESLTGIKNQKDNF